MKKPINNNTDSYLEERVKHLEGVERFVIDSLEVAASLGDFQNSINKLHDVITILEETGTKVKGLIPFETVAFFLVDEENNNFTLQHIDSENHRAYIQSEVDNSIDDGIFAWALREKRPVVVPTKDHQKSLVFHSMATATRIRGMFIGLLNKDVHGILNVSLSLLSFILFNSANAIESFELYRKIREINRNLERIDNYRLLFEAAPDGVEVVDAVGNIIDSNDSQKKLLGYSQEQLIGRLSSDYFSEKSRASLLNNPSSLNESGYWEGEVELVTATGETVPVWRKERAIYDNAHRFIGAVVYNRDNTNRKRAEEEKRSLEERLNRAERMEAIGTLAGGVAHDLNNMLGILVGNAELLYYDMRKTDPLRELAEEIKTSGEQAAAVVQDLLTMARRGIVLREPSSLNRIVANQLKTSEIRKMLSSKPQVIIETEYDRDLLDINASAIHIERALTNLISNALHAIPEKGTITIRTENRYLDRPLTGYEDVRKGEYAVLSVSDTGSGILPEHLKHIFEPFYMRKVLKYGGSGLGLSVVWGALKDHDGYIDVTSDPGKGTTFDLYFPVTRDESVKLEDLSVSEYKGNGETILVVDDEENQCRLVTRMLTRLNYRVKTVGSGEEALEYLANYGAALIVLDMIMEPGIDGYETYRRILDIKKRQKAIIFSGFTKTERVKMAQELGAGEFVKKPYLLERLGMAVRKELDRK